MPIIVLGGSDRKPGRLPELGRDEHPLSGYKGADVRIQGRPLVVELIDRLVAAGCFGPIYLAGPHAAYASLESPAELIPTDGGFGDNIRASMEAVRLRHPDTHVAFITCDVLPDPDSLARLMEQCRRAMPADMWYPLVRAPERREKLGASSWKPAYRVPQSEGGEPVAVLPGHLVVVDPEAMRLPFIYRLFDLGYRTRNRPIDKRRWVMIRGVIFELLYQDVLHLFSLRAPSLTWGVLGAGLSAGRRLRDGEASRRTLEKALRRMFAKSRHRRRHPDRRILLPLIEDLSLALDIDTEEEARAAGGDLQSTA
jgi:hypothetical protein